MHSLIREIVLNFHLRATHLSSRLDSTELHTPLYTYIATFRAITNHNAISVLGITQANEKDKGLCAQ